ncbi:Deoxyribonuclease-2-beta isoform 4 [Schistosoma japonicum]|nr:Deoxyribonuclease-2-beta isoform 4 [Schistosoma japonicum]
MKGAFAFDNSDIGFWVIHSIPKLSYSNTSYVYPKTGRIYGQHFLCLTLEKKYINFIITQFTLARPLFQSAYISPSVKLKFPDLAKLLENTKVPTESQNNIVELQTANKALQLKHFSKSSDFGKDLYADFVAPTLKKSLDTETWQHDGSLPSACHRQYSVKNIKSIYIEVSKTTITNPHDHAKWAVTVSSNDLVEDTNNWVCLGDINRQPHQFYRGGGTMCIMNQQLWQSFYTTIQSVEECGKIISIVTYLFKQLSFVIEIVQYVFIMNA